MRKTLWVSLLLVFGFVAVPADAAPHHYLTLRGARSASFELTFPARFRADIGYGPEDITVTTKGTYAGVWFENLARPVLAQGAVVVPAIDGPAGPVAVAWGSSDRDDFSLPGGRYRVHLLSDGAAQVRVGITGLPRDVAAAPSVPTQTRARLVDLSVPAGSAGTTTIPLNVRPSTMTVLFAATDADWGFTAGAHICVDAEPGTPCEMNGSKVTGSGGGIGSRLGTGTGIFLYPGDLKNGEHVAEYTVATGGVPRGVWAFALSLR